MTDLLKRAATWLADRREALLSRPVTYARGNSSVEVPATVGKTVFRLDARDGSGVIVVATRDYLVRATDLVLNGAPTLPRRGDQVRESDGDRVITHEVSSPGGASGGEWRYSDPQRVTLRIHTQQIQEQTL